jgi:RNA polymerase sigma-70 factor (ECF subfamily)
LFFKKKIDFNENDLDSIIAACLEQNKQAQHLLIKLFLGYAKSISMRYVSNTMEVEEVINDGFLKVFNNLTKFDQSQPFKAWLRTIIINTAIDHYRKNLKFTHHVEIDTLQIADFNDDIISKISADEIMALVKKLSPVYRMVFTLYVVDGYIHREIAEMLGIQEGTSKSNLQDARKKLQVMIKNAYPHLHLAYALKTTRINEN